MRRVLSTAVFLLVLAALTVPVLANTPVQTIAAAPDTSDVNMEMLLTAMASLSVMPAAILGSVRIYRKKLEDRRGARHTRRDR